MTIPRNSKLWLRDLPGKLWIIEEIKNLMMKCGVSYSYGLKASEDIHCLYIYEQTYTFGTSPTHGIGSPFYKADGKLIQLKDLFPSPILLPDTKYKVQLYGYQDGFELAQKWAFNHGYKWNKGMYGENTRIQDGKSYGIFFYGNGKLTYCSGEKTYPGESGTELYLSQLLNTSNNGEQVKVQGPHQPEPGCTGSSAGRLQSRHCKITTGRRYTGYPVSHLRSRPKVRPSTVSGSICKPGYSDSSYGTQGPQRGTGRAAEAERGAVLDPLDTIKRKYQPYKS